MSKIFYKFQCFEEVFFQHIATLSGKIPALEKWVADHEKKEIPVQFYDNRIKQRTVDGEYTTALNYLDSIRIFLGNQWKDSLFSKGIDIHAEIFAKAKIEQEQNNSMPIDSLIKEQFHAVFNNLNDSVKTVVSYYLAGADI